MSVRIRTRVRRSAHRFVSNLLLGTFGMQSGAVLSPLPERGGSVSEHELATVQSSAVRSVLEAQPPPPPPALPIEVFEDPTALTVTASLVRTLLWPPNHVMRDVGLAVTVTDGSGSTLSLSVQA